MKCVKFISLLAMSVVLAASLMIVGCGQKRSAKSGADTGGKRIDSLQTIYFDFDKSDIRGDQKDTLQGNSQWLSQNSKTRVTIEGNCDERGSEEYNIALGQRRANSVRNYLVSSGVAADRLSTVSYGEEKPTCTDSSESCWAKNRRGEFTKK